MTIEKLAKSLDMLPMYFPASVDDFTTNYVLSDTVIPIPPKVDFGAFGGVNTFSTAVSENRIWLYDIQLNISAPPAVSIIIIDRYTSDVINSFTLPVDLKSAPVVSVTDDEIVFVSYITSLSFYVPGKDDFRYAIFNVDGSHSFYQIDVLSVLTKFRDYALSVPNSQKSFNNGSQVYYSNGSVFIKLLGQVNMNGNAEVVFITQDIKVSGNTLIPGSIDKDTYSNSHNAKDFRGSLNITLNTSYHVRVFDYLWTGREYEQPYYSSNVYAADGTKVMTGAGYGVDILTRHLTAKRSSKLEYKLFGPQVIYAKLAYPASQLGGTAGKVKLYFVVVDEHGRHRDFETVYFDIGLSSNEVVEFAGISTYLLSVDKNFNFYLAVGLRVDGVYTGRDRLLIKVSSSGIILWNRRIVQQFSRFFGDTFSTQPWIMYDNDNNLVSTFTVAAIGSSKLTANPYALCVLNGKTGEILWATTHHEKPSGVLPVNDLSISYTPIHRYFKLNEEQNSLEICLLCIDWSDKMKAATAFVELKLVLDSKFKCFSTPLPLTILEMDTT